MNTDFLILDEIIRNKQYKKNISSHNNNNENDTRYYNDSCNTIKTYAKEQNTLYNPQTNQILYGINTNMHALGVSDGTCNQINPSIFTPNYICGAGAAGGNRCYANNIENFENNCNSCNGCNVTYFVTCLILIFALMGIFYMKTHKKS